MNGKREISLLSAIWYAGSLRTYYTTDVSVLLRDLPFGNEGISELPNYYAFLTLSASDHRYI